MWPQASAYPYNYAAASTAAQVPAGQQAQYPTAADPAAQAAYYQYYYQQQQQQLQQQQMQAGATGAQAYAGTAPSAHAAAYYQYYAQQGYPAGYYAQQGYPQGAYPAQPDPEAEEAKEQRKADLLPTSCNANYNINDMLAQNIQSSDYWIKNLCQMHTIDELLDEIHNKVTNVEPFCVGMGKAPSTAFCIIFRMCTLGLTRTELKKMLKRKDSPYLRACAMLYMRYTLVNEMLWEQFEPLLDDPTEFVAGFDKNCTISIGQFADQLLREKQHSNTILPRIKEAVRREIDKRLLERELASKRGSSGGKFREGMHVQALFSEDQQWYEAVIKSCKPDGKYLVEYTEYGNSEVVPASSIRGASSSSRSRSHSRSRSRSRARRSRSRSPHRSGGVDEAELERMVRERAKNAAVTGGRDYARKPLSLKMGLAMAPTVGTARKRSKSPPPPPRTTSSTARRDDSPPRPKQPSAEHIARMQKLKEMYGDSSAKDKK